jgi:transcription elongation factor GreA-like protein
MQKTMNIDNLTTAQKQLLLTILERQLGIKADPEKLDPYVVESRKCNQIAKMKKEGKSIIYTELQ